MLLGLKRARDQQDHREQADDAAYPPKPVSALPLRGSKDGQQQDEGQARHYDQQYGQ